MNKICLIIAMLMGVAWSAQRASGVPPEPLPRKNLPSELTIASIGARLFYSETGRLSDDLLARQKPFYGWNTIIGEGDAEEHADDLLITVKLEPSGGSAHDQKFVDAPLVLTVSNSVGKQLGSRTFQTTLTSDQGTDVKALWLNDVTCEGALKIVAKYNGERKSATIPFDCGE